MLRAFILVRPIDLDIALPCLQHFASRGWDVKFLCDSRDWHESTLPINHVTGRYSSPQRGMFGNECALGITQAILANSSSVDIVLKTDCDVWLSQECSRWMSQADKLRALRISRKGRRDVWGGCWSSSHESLREASKELELQAKCACPESILHLMAFHKTVGTEIHESWIAHVSDGEEMIDAHLVTLPIAKAIDRKACGIKMFEEQAKCKL